MESARGMPTIALLECIWIGRARKSQSLAEGDDIPAVRSHRSYLDPELQTSCARVHLSQPRELLFQFRLVSHLSATLLKFRKSFSSWQSNFRARRISLHNSSQETNRYQTPLDGWEQAGLISSAYRALSANYITLPIGFTFGWKRAGICTITSQRPTRSLMVVSITTYLHYCRVTQRRQERECQEAAAQRCCLIS